MSQHLVERRTSLYSSLCRVQMSRCALLSVCCLHRDYCNFSVSLSRNLLIAAVSAPDCYPFISISTQNANCSSIITAVTWSPHRSSWSRFIWLRSNHRSIILAPRGLLSCATICHNQVLHGGPTVSWCCQSAWPLCLYKDRDMTWCLQAENKEKETPLSIAASYSGLREAMVTVARNLATRHWYSAVRLSSSALVSFMSTFSNDCYLLHSASYPLGTAKSCLEHAC